MADSVAARGVPDGRARAQAIVPSGSAAAKRALDVLLSGAGLLVSMPLWLLAAAAVKMEDGGPVFYSQERVGRHRCTFRVFKFRSMIPDAEAVVGAVLTSFIVTMLIFGMAFFVRDY